MLVLSRKKNQSIRFPQLDITVHIKEIDGRRARIGVDAPRDIQILRGELVDESNQESGTAAARALYRHERRNELNKARVGLALAQKLLESGQTGEAEKILSYALHALEQLDAAATSEAMELDQSSPINAITELDATSHRRALVVEDNENERELLAGYLRLSGFQVDTASNGLEAIRYLSKAGKNLPQAVLLDMRMPMLDGPKTVSNIRFRPELRNLRVYAVSGTSPDELSLAIGPKGVDRWFSKPVNPEEIVSQICKDEDELSPSYVWPLGVTYVPGQPKAKKSTTSQTSPAMAEL